MVTTFIKRKQFTADEYHRMEETGILQEDDRVELIEGEIVTMTPIGLRHMACVNRVIDVMLPLQAQKNVILHVQSPIYIDEFNEPEPDIALLDYRDDFYENKRPSAEDTLLVVEVADSSLPYDQNIKVPLYAKSRIHELWIIDLPSRTLHSFRYSNGTEFQDMQQHHAGDHFAPLAFPDHTVPISSILGSTS